MRVFVGYALERDHINELKGRLDEISRGIEDAGAEAYAHVRDGQSWKFHTTSIPEMMIEVFARIRDADLMLLDLTTIGNSRRTGLNIELGFAKALGKPVLAIWRKPDRPVMTTDLAIAEASYADVGELRGIARSLIEQCTQTGALQMPLK